MARWNERRRAARELRRLDREYAAWAAGPRRPRPRRDVDRTGLVAAAVTVAALVGMVVAVPSLLPAPVRQLVGLGADPLAAAGSGSGTFAFLEHQPGSRVPVAYDPCVEVPVRINADGAPDGAVDLVRKAMAEVGAATGLDLRYDGSTTERPDWDSAFSPSFDGRRQARPVLVTWATEDEVPELDGDVVGLGGSAAVEMGDGVVRYVTGGVTLDRDAFARIARRHGGAAEMRAIVLHELGHVVGLAHVEDRGELMNGDNVGLLDFGPGDRRGLAVLGSGSCE